MLFNSYVFLFAFLPATLLGFWLASRSGRPRLGLWWLNAVSLFFYAWWAPKYTALLLVSVLFNFGIGRLMARPSGADVVAGPGRFPSRKAMLRLGVVGNLAALGYFKYANFFIDSVNQVSGAGFQLARHHPAAGHLVLHLHADRLPGGHATSGRRRPAAISATTCCSCCSSPTCWRGRSSTTGS